MHRHLFSTTLVLAVAATVALTGCSVGAAGAGDTDGSATATSAPWKTAKSLARPVSAEPAWRTFASGAN